MTNAPDPFERRLADRLTELSQTALPGRAPTDDVAAAAMTARNTRPWRFALVGVTVMLAAAVTMVALNQGPSGLGSESATPSASGVAVVDDPSASCAGGVDDPSEFVDLLRVITYDYEPFETPRAQAMASDLVVVGHIRDVEAGPSDIGRLGTAVITVTVSEVVSGDADLVTAESVFVRVPWREDVAASAAAMPCGRILLFLAHVTQGSRDDLMMYENAPLFTPLVQGFWIEGPERAVGVYEDIGGQPPGWEGVSTIDELVLAAMPHAGNVAYSCGGHAFTPELFDEPELELSSLPAGRALAEFIASGQRGEPLLPPDGWRLAGFDETTASFVASLPGDQHYAAAEAEKEEDAWRIAGWSQCQPTVVLDGVNVAEWTIAAGQEINATTTSFLAEVTERACASGQSSEDRIRSPLISYGPDRIVIIFAVEPLAGAGDCPTNPASAVRVELSEPVGNRELLDGSRLPLRDPTRAD